MVFKDFERFQRFMSAECKLRMTIKVLNHQITKVSTHFSNKESAGTETKKNTDNEKFSIENMPGRTWLLGS